MNLIMRDIQLDPVIGFCEICGRELYSPRKLCDQCQEEAERGEPVEDK